MSILAFLKKERDVLMKEAETATVRPEYVNKMIMAAGGSSAAGLEVHVTPARRRAPRGKASDRIMSILTRRYPESVKKSDIFRSLQDTCSMSTVTQALVRLMKDGRIKWVARGEYAAFSDKVDEHKLL